MPSKRPILRYGILALLFVMTVAYEIPYLHDIVTDKTVVPFFFMELASDRVAVASKDASQAGIHNGDEVLSINGHAYRGSSDWAQPYDRTPAGGTIAVVVRADPASPERTVTLPVRAKPSESWRVIGEVSLFFLLPGVCVLLGFWVAVQRPHDPMAWLLLGLMLTFPHIFESYKIESWPPGWREAAVFYHVFLGSMLPVMMFLFGRFFPEPFPAGTRLERIWKLQQWVLALPFAIFAILSTIESVIGLSSYRSAVPLENATHPVDRIVQIFGYLLVGSFFAAMGTKYGISRSPDARRRLLILYWGATVAWTPGLLLLIVYPKVLGKTAPEVLPQWAIVMALIPLTLFPLTLAYVIVVQKAMGVGVALRQGLQYALARGGVRVLQILLIATVTFTGILMAEDPGRNRPQKITVIALGITAAVTIIRLGGQARTWIDRRFFREAYDAEQMLIELSDQVRTMVEPKSLLETVATRISQTLHVPQVAVLLGGGELYRPAFAMGYANVSEVSFSQNTGTAKVLRQQKEPARVFLNDRDSWLYREEDIGEEERAKLATLGSELLLPLAVRDKLLGFISLGPKKSEEPYTRSDVRLLKSVAAQTGMALENANLMREIASEVSHRERLNREVEIAREVQERLFPQKLPAIAGLDYAGHCRPALGVGGDYYDFLGLPQGHLGVAIGDVSGKGIAAALTMATLQASLRGEATRAPENLAAAVANINRLVYEASSENRYATFFYGQYDPVNRKFDYVNAGHNPPMLFHRSDGRWTVSRLDIGGTVVGLLETFPYQQGCVSLAPGDLLVAYTDGISEAMNSADEEWGEEQMMETVKDCDAMAAQDILERVFTAADQFVAGAKQHDDMTLVVMRVVLAQLGGD
ncbi:MAG TPA: SpoIIE family protein phosphatase [Terriglobales bacterium]|nr:SpoIIE family protein phosphatase [Terriglobales bacterium]